MATYYNVRYGMMMIPAVGLFFAYVAYQRRTLIATGLALLVAFGLVGTFLSVPYALDDPLHGVVRDPWSQPAGAWLHDYYHGGNILISYAALAPTIYFANEPDNDFITDSNGAQFKTALAHPNQWATWVVMSKDTPADLVATTLEPRDDWRQYYVLSKTYGPVEIYQRSDTLIGPAIASPIPTSTPTSGSVVVATPSPTAVRTTSQVTRPAPTATPARVPTPTIAPSPTPTSTPTPTPTPTPSPTP
jgi:hypothetical protein